MKQSPSSQPTKSLLKTLTTPPPPRSPEPKHPLFTKKFFSTKSFGPGHLVGAGILVLGIFGLTKLAISRGQTEAERTRRLAQQPRPSTKAEDARGQYARSP